MFTADVWYSKVLGDVFWWCFVGLNPKPPPGSPWFGAEVESLPRCLAWPCRAESVCFVETKPRYAKILIHVIRNWGIQTYSNHVFFVFLVNYLCSSAGSMADEIHNHPDVMYPMYLNQGQKMVPFNKDISTKDSFLALSSCFSRVFLAHEVQSA